MSIFLKMVLVVLLGMGVGAVVAGDGNENLLSYGMNEPKIHEFSKENHSKLKITRQHGLFTLKEGDQTHLFDLQDLCLKEALLLLDLSQNKFELSLSEGMHPELLGALKEKLKRLKEQERFFNANAFKERLPESIEKSLELSLESHDLPILGGSTASLTQSEGTNPANIPTANRVLYAYGALDEGPEFTLEMTREKNCLLLSALHCEEMSSLFEMDDGKHYQETDFLVANEASPIRVNKHCSETHAYGPEAKNLRLAKSLLDQHKPILEAVLLVFQSHHPQIHPNHIRLFFYANLQLELSLTDEIDILQDLAAMEYAGAPQKMKLVDGLKSLEGSVITKMKRKIMASFLGEVIWKFESWRRGMPMDVQGYGPVQIIPNLSLNAMGHEQIMADYWPLLDSEGKKDVFNDSYKTIFKYIFDPQKMFVLKMIQWDVQLTQLEAFDSLTLSILSPPHIRDSKTAHELALLYGTYHLVQFPEVGKQVFDKIIHDNLSNTITNLYVLGHFLNHSPEFEGIEKIEVSSNTVCPVSSFGHFSFLPGPKYCLISKSEILTRH